MMARQTDQASQDLRKYLDPKVLSKISGLELRARLVVEGFYAGMHRSPHHGLSVEFADHRIYTQGDDIRHVDWKLFGRTDKYYIKEFEQETNLELMLVVDCSESMAYRSDGSAMSKHEYATTVAAALAYLALQQHDSVGLALFDEEVTRLIKPSNSPHHLRAIVRELDGKVGKAKTSMERVFRELAERISRRTLIFIISDLFHDADAIIKGFKMLRYRRHEPVVFNTWDQAELAFNFKGATMFEGLEEAGELLTDPQAMRARYLDEIERFQTKLRAGLSKMQIDYVVMSSAEPLDSALTAYLATRSARIRRRSSRVLAKG